MKYSSSREDFEEVPADCVMRSNLTLIGTGQAFNYPSPQPDVCNFYQLEFHNYPKLRSEIRPYPSSEFGEQVDNQNVAYIGGQRGQAEGDRDFGECRKGGKNKQIESENEV
ncbi:hypothetical protein ACH5RR_037162 [Cinchona calisaya]|uniref:Uncharacterized protein n=1 Tax=Cinchona calisaya TaxID=153742 RepID=A0ABD2YAT6_9GENT